MLDKNTKKLKDDICGANSSREQPLHAYAISKDKLKDELPGFYCHDSRGESRCDYCITIDRTRYCDFKNHDHPLFSSTPQI